MAISSTAVLRKGAGAFDPWAAASEQLHQICQLIDAFREWEREAIILGEPTPEAKQEHRASLKWLLLMSNLVECAASSPEFPDRAALRELNGKVWQLRESWKMIYEPMSDAEADKLLTEVFPDGR